MQEHEDRDKPGVIVLPPVPYVAALLVGLALHYFVPVHFLPAGINVLLGILVVAVSVPIVISAIWEMRRAQTPFDVRKPATALVTQGVFRFSRNPGYLSMTIFYIGLSLLVNSLWVLLSLIPVLLLMQQGVIKREERYLKRKFGEQYLRYKHRVRRWI